MNEQKRGVGGDRRMIGGGGGPEGLTKLQLLSLISARVEMIRRRRLKRGGKTGGKGRWVFIGEPSRLR